MSAPPKYAFSADPRALTDLMQAPAEIRDQALMHLQDIVAGQLEGDHLTRELDGYRKVYVDLKKQWRLVYGKRPAPPQSTHPTEVYLVAVRPRARHNIYDTVAARLGLNPGPLSALTHAARARSPQTAAPTPPPGPVSHPSRPQSTHHVKGRVR